jgi:hypothetical protein
MNSEDIDVIDDLSKYVKNIREKANPETPLQLEKPKGCMNEALNYLELKEKFDALKDTVKKERELSLQLQNEQADWRQVIIQEIANIQQPKAVYLQDPELDALEKEIIKVLLIHMKKDLKL